MKAQCCPQVSFGGPFEIFEGHILPSVKHNPIHFFLQKLNLPLQYAGTKLALKFREKKWLILPPVQIERKLRK